MPAIIVAAFLVARLASVQEGPQADAELASRLSLCDDLERITVLALEPGDAFSLDLEGRDELFRDGVRWHDRLRWGLSLRRMCQAIAVDPQDDPSTVVIFSTKRVSYVPNTFAALAAASLGLCREAEIFHAAATEAGVAAELERALWKELRALLRKRCGTEGR